VTSILRIATATGYVLGTVSDACRLGIVYDGVPVSLVR
jgi:hypothetical protein